MNKLNQNLSDNVRSHFILRVGIKLSSKIESVLNFVDLAGSENVKLKGNQEEGKYINTSIFHLNHVIQQLSVK